jgi:Tol biopolymer transport system component
LIDWANEELITFKTDGIYQISLDTGDSEVIVARDEGWQLFSASLSYDGQEAVYWFVENDTYQVWILDTISGDTKQLLDTEDNGITSVHGNWLGQGSFLEMEIWGEDENGVPLVVQWYLFDIRQGTIAGSADERPGKRICHLLAVSPRSNQAATWCSFDSQFEIQREYIVIEADGEYWQTTTSPEQPLFEPLGEDGRQIWSPDGNYVLMPRSLNATLVYVPEPQVSQLFESDSSSFNTFLSRFSPSGRWVSYRHSVCENDNFCIKLIDVETKSVVWESSGVFTPPIGGIYAWSPDERFFVIHAKDGTYIIDTFDFSVVKVLPSQLITTIEVAWLDN